MMKTIAFTIAGAALAASNQGVSEDLSPTELCMQEWSQMIVCISECDDLSYSKAGPMPSCIGETGGDPEKMRQNMMQMCDQYGVEEYKSWYSDYASEDDCPEPTAPTAPPTDPPTYNSSVYCKQEYSQKIVSVSSCDELHSYWPECVAEQGGDPAAFALLLEEQCNQYGLEEYQGWYQDCAEDIDNCVDYYQAQPYNIENYHAAPAPAGSAGAEQAEVGSTMVAPAQEEEGSVAAARGSNPAGTADVEVSKCDHDPPGCPEEQPQGSLSTPAKGSAEGSKRLMERLIRGSA